MQQLNWSREGSTLKLYGKLDQYVLNPLWDSRIETMQGITLIDLSAVISIDTAGVALLIHLVETGKKRGVNVRLTRVSDNIIILAQLYNLPDDVLPY